MDEAASEQERIVQTLLSHAFGSPLLFRPKKYSKKTGGWKQEEPADLAWVHDNLVALFYMNESRSQPLEKQIKHNQRQPHRYVRLWASKDERFIFRGTNAFGDECARTFDSFEYLLAVSIVSARCGAQIIANRTFGKKGFTLILPAEFVHALAHADGTFVDLLQMARIHQGFRPAAAETVEQAFARLMNEWGTFVANAQRRGCEILRGGCPAPSTQTLRAIYTSLANHRLRGGAAQSAITPEARAMLGKMFGDMTVGDFLYLAYTVVQLFYDSGLALVPGIDAPVFHYNTVARMDAWHHGFVLYTVHIGGGNNTERVARVTDLALAACQAGFEGRAQPASLLISFESTGFSDPRYPSILAFIPRDGRFKPERQTFAESIMDALLDEALPSDY